MIVDRYQLVDQLDDAIEREIGAAYARALNGEAHPVSDTDQADRWRNLATLLHDCASWADQLAGTRPAQVTPAFLPPT